eukprot:SAG11_NODE_246_length_11683_cov_15.540142_7_plen_102_part_00
MKSVLITIPKRDFNLAVIMVSNNSFFPSFVEKFVCDRVPVVDFYIDRLTQTNHTTANHASALDVITHRSHLKIRLPYQAYDFYSMYDALLYRFLVTVAIVG